MALQVVSLGECLSALVAPVRVRVLRVLRFHVFRNAVGGGESGGALGAREADFPVKLVHVFPKVIRASVSGSTALLLQKTST